MTTKERLHKLVDEEALAEVQADRAAGVLRISCAEIKRKLGYP